LDIKRVVVFKWAPIPNQRYPSGNGHAVYDSNYVNKHYKMISKYLKNFEYICITDDSSGLDSSIKVIPLWDKCRYLGGCYNRLYLLSKDMKDIIGGSFLHIDLDTTITSDLSHLFINDNTTFFRFTAGNINNYQIGIAYIKSGEFDSIWETFYVNIEENVQISKRLYNGTDQAWLNYYIHKNKINPTYWDSSDGIYNVVHLRTKIKPNNICILSWAGPRDPYENRATKTVPWVKDFLI